MKIAEFSVKNYQFTIIMFVMVLALGVNSLLNMPRSEDPIFESPFFSVIVVYPGTSPKDMEELVVDPIEEKLSGIENVKKMISSVNDGVAVIQVECVYNVDIDAKYDEVVREINTVRPSLPEGILDIKIQRFSPEGVNILQAGLLSETASYKELEAQGEILRKRLAKIKALKAVETWAFPKQQVRISLNLEKMAQNKVPLNRVFQALQSENVNIPGGSVEAGPKKLNIKTSGSYENIEEIKNTIIGSNGQAILHLGDLAEVSFDTEPETHIARLNGKRGIWITASQKGGNNIFKVGDRMKPILDQFVSELPSHIKFEQNFDQVESVRKRLMGLARDFGIAILLVLITLIPLGFRAAIIVMISIPLSLAIGLGALDFLGYSINQLSIVGLVVALGLLVDDSIVVVENIERWIRNGYDRRTAAIEATKQIGLAVLGCTATLIFAFLPLAFLPESSGDFIRSLPMAVIVTIIASLFVSLTIVPFLASMILSKDEHPEGNFFLRLLKKGIEGSYRQMLNKGLANPKTTLLIALGFFLGSLALVPKVGFSVFPKSEKPQFLIQIELPLGANLDATDKAARWVEAELSKTPRIKYYATNVGMGNPRIYYNVIPRNKVANFAEIFVILEPMEGEEKSEIALGLRNKMTGYAGAKIQVKEFEQGAPVEAPVAIRIFGDNLDSLRAISLRVEKLIKETKGTIYVNNPLAMVNTDLKLEINKDKAGLLGIPTAEIDRTVRLALAGIKVGNFQDTDGDNFDMSVSIEQRSNHPKLDILDKVYVSSVTGALIPLNQISTLRLQSSPTVIRHYDKDRFCTITSSIDEGNGYLVTNVNKEVVKKLETLKLPKGYRYVAAGELERASESFGGLGPIVLITIFGILAILILEFRTFKSTLIVLSVVPLGVIGAVLILLITGYNFSFVAIVGVIALIGIEVKNSILLVDYTNQLRESGLGIDEAIQEAGETRFVPIILTSLTAIGGLLPLALERNPLFSPLAWVMIGGLISSTILTRIVTPVLYKLLPPSIQK